MRCLLVLAHPLEQSLSARLAGVVERAVRAAGWQVQVHDLYGDDFDPRLTSSERAGYYSGFVSGLPDAPGPLARADVVILVFPTWWFGFPAILKGWFDRVWAPGLAYDHAPAGGPMRPRLQGLRAVMAVTTLGSPFWVDWLVMGRPLARVLRRGIVRPCAPGATVLWRALYRAETVAPDRLTRFEARLTRDISLLAKRLSP